MPTDHDDDDGYDAGKEAYRNRRDRFIRDRYGLTEEEMAALNQTGVVDATDVNLHVADATYRLFGGFGAAEKRVKQAARAARDVERAADDVREIVSVVEKLRKLFR